MRVRSPAASDYTMDQTAFSRAAGESANLIAFFEQLPGTSRRALASFSECREAVRQAKRCPRLSCAIQFLLWDRPNLLFRSRPPPRNHTCRANLLALQRREISAHWAGNCHRALSLRQFCGIVDHSRISALQFPPSDEACRALSPEEINFSLRFFPFRNRSGDSNRDGAFQPASPRQSWRKSSGPPPRRTSTTSTTSSALPIVQSQRLIHVRDQRHYLLAHPFAGLHHEFGEKRRFFFQSS